MLDNQRFCRADSHIICIKVLHDHCHIRGPLSPMREFREAGSHRIKMQICLASCLSCETMKKGIIQNVQFLWTTQVSCRSLKYSKLTVLLWIMAFVCPSHHLLALISAHSVTGNSDRINLGLKLAFGDIQLTEELLYQVLRLEYLFNCTSERSNKLSLRYFVIILDCFHEMVVAQHMFICFPDHTGIYSETSLLPLSFCDLQMIGLCLVAAVIL